MLLVQCEIIVNLSSLNASGVRIPQQRLTKSLNVGLNFGSTQQWKPVEMVGSSKTPCHLLEILFWDGAC